MPPKKAPANAKNKSGVVGNKMIQAQPKAGSGGFAKNPQNINRKGQPRKSFSTINLSLKEKGIEKLSKAVFVEMYNLIFNATETELKELAADKDIPMVVRLIILELQNTKTRSRALADYRDYMFGKAEQSIITPPENLKPVRYIIVEKKAKS